MRPLLQNYLTQENFLRKVVHDSFPYLMEEATVLPNVLCHFNSSFTIPIEI